MIEKKVNGVWSVTFNTVSEFYKFITESSENAVFKGMYSLESKGTGHGSEVFTKTKSFEEAAGLLLNGWTEKAQELEKRVKAVRRDMALVTTKTLQVGMAGFQPIIPLFLAGQPAAMLGSKMQPKKQKVVTVVKSISYPGYVDADEWTEEGIKALSLVMNLEKNGYRCNVDIIRAGYDSNRNDGYGVSCRVRIKHANERLNVSKLAFPMCHPSMQRRMMFRFTETYNKVTSGYKYGYGRPFRDSGFNALLDKRKEAYIPAFFKGDPSKIKKLEDVERLGNWI